MKSLITKAMAGIDRVATRQITRETLKALDDRTLKDIGLSRDSLRRRHYHWL